MESILDSTKSLLGGKALTEETVFDQELIMHINGALMVINQLGVGPSTGFRIKGQEDNWTSIIGERTDLELIKTAVFLRVQLLFDPPQNAFLVEAIKDQIKEYDWRIENHYVPVPEV